MNRNDMLAIWNRAVAAFWLCESQGGFYVATLESKREWNQANRQLLAIGLTLPQFVARGGSL